MKQNILEDNDFKLEVTKEIDDNLRLTNTYKNDVHTDVEEMLLTRNQQRALKEFLLIVYGHILLIQLRLRD